MRLSSGYKLVLLGALLAMPLASSASAQPPRSEGGRSETSSQEGAERQSGMAAPVAPKDKKPSHVALDALKLPARAVFVLYDEAKDALQLLPRLVVMTPAEYQGLQDQIEQLRKQLRSDKPEIPSVCKIKGRIAGDLAHLEVHFEFRTEAQRTTIRLGCQKGWPTSAKLDGKMPWLRQTEDGLVVVVDSPGKHEVDLQLLVPIVTRRGPRGPERSLDLDLPRTALTSIERLELPARVTEARLGTRPLRLHRQPDQTEVLENVLAGPGAVDRLDLSWQPQRNEGAIVAPPVFADSQRVVVRVHDTEVSTEAEITLRVLRGEMSRWQVRIPAPGATSVELKPVAQEEERIASIEKKTEGSLVSWEVRTKEPTSDALRLLLQVRQPRPKGRLDIGPIAVVGALTQRGELEVRAAEDLRLFLQEAPELNRRELTEEQRRDKVRASYAYGSTGQTPAAQPLISIQLQEVKGAVEVRTVQTLRLLDSEKDKPAAWRLITRVEATPVRTGLDRLELTWPAGYRYDEAVGPVPAELIEEVVADADSKRLVIKLAQRQTKPFSFTITGSYALPDPQAHAINLELPCPTTWGDERGNSGQKSPVLDRGGEVTAQLPDSLELFDAATGRSLPPRPVKGLGTFALLFTPSNPHPAAVGVREYVWAPERLPRSLELSWRPFRPEMPVEVTADLFISSGKVRVRERMQFQFLQPPPPQMPIQTPRGIELEAVEGGQFVGGAAAGGERDLILQTPVGKVHTITFDYVVALAAPTENAVTEFVAPFFQTLLATRGRTRVRIWSDANLRIAPASNEWVVGPPEVVADRDSLPALVLNGALQESVTLSRQLISGRAAAVLVDRVLIRATNPGNGSQNYRMRLAIQHLADHHLDLEFPVTLGRNKVDISLGGKRLPFAFVDAAGKESEVGQRARVAIEPELYRLPVILEVEYEIDADRLNDPARFRPAFLLDSVLLGRVRWQVNFAGDVLPVLVSAGYVREQRWGWRGWLWGPRPAVSTAELDQWLQGTPGATGSDSAESGLVCWKSSVGELRVTLAPLRFWLLSCSLCLLLLAVAGAYLPAPPLVRGAVVTIATLLVAATGLFWPDMLGLIAFGCEPALLILGILLLIRLPLHHRYRQQLVFMPGFQQLKNGSSLSKKKDGSKIRRDLPTVEAQPAKPASASTESGT
jgi:hypothetical protein